MADAIVLLDHFGRSFTCCNLLALAGRTLIGGAGLSYIDASGRHALDFARDLASDKSVGFSSAMRQVSGMIAENDSVWITTGNDD